MEITQQRPQKSNVEFLGTTSSICSSPVNPLISQMAHSKLQSNTSNKYDVFHDLENHTAYSVFPAQNLIPQNVVTSTPATQSFPFGMSLNARETTTNNCPLENAINQTSGHIHANNFDPLNLIQRTSNQENVNVNSKPHDRQFEPNQSTLNPLQRQSLLHHLSSRNSNSNPFNKQIQSNELTLPKSHEDLFNPFFTATPTLNPLNPPGAVTSISQSFNYLPTQISPPNRNTQPRSAPAPPNSFNPFLIDKNASNLLDQSAQNYTKDNPFVFL